MQEIPKDPFDELEEWVNGENIVEVREAPREPDGYINYYERNGWPDPGKVFFDRDIADRAVEIARQYEKPCFRVNIYLK